ncbi:MAG: DUF4032 domain-containing protein [Marmoricola sp.]
MPLRIVANRPDPQVFRLPWDAPVEEWTEHVVPLPRGLSRHVVRIVRLGDTVYAVKETQEPIAWREYNMLRNLQRLQLPAVVPHGVVTGRVAADGEELPAALITRHLSFALPYRSLFSHGMRAESLPLVVDAFVVLLVRLHLAGFYWGDVSLSNVLFRRNAGAFAAYLVDAETGELQPDLSRNLRLNDLTVGTENVFAELLDLKAGNLVSHEVDPRHIVDLVQKRYTSLWEELTGVDEFDAGEMWRIEQRVSRLNELGFDVEELDVVTDWDGSTVQLHPRVVELGHHCREFRDLTGLDVEDNQARVLLNDIAAYTAHAGLGGEDRMLVANQWLHKFYEPIMAMVPQDQRGKLEGPEVYHQILEHRWYLSERAGYEIDTFDTARDYIANVLTHRPDEAITTPEDDPDELLPRAD